MGKPLTFDAANDRFIYSDLLGQFYYRSGPMAGLVCHKLNSYGYAVLYINGRPHQAHRVAWLLMTGQIPSGPIDHINGDRADNRFLNLRLADHSINNQNRSKPQRDNRTSKFLGVCGWTKWPGKFRAQIKVMGKKIHLGVFDTEEAAAQAYLEAKRRLHAGFVEERFA